VIAGTKRSPVLEGDALAAVRHRGGHLQIIASAGSGKTEVVAQRVADLLAEEGADPRGIVAFTFTERAANELKERITARVEERQGPSGVDRLVGLFVGTIHAYCFRLLNQRVPRYATYDVLDDHQLTAFLSREAKRLGVRVLDDPKGRLFASIASFLRGVDVVENELLDPTSMPEPFRTILCDYYDTLERYRLLTYGQQVVRAVTELEGSELAAEVHAELRHLIVDEYQDVNPAQERLVALLAGPRTEVCVVGDDDQAIYAWRGSDVANIVTFAERYPTVATFEITTNRRSRPQIVEVANRFATTIPARLDKVMAPQRDSQDGAPEVVVWQAPTELEEAGWIAKLVLDLHDAGVAFADIAVLVRGRSAYPRLVEQFASFDIPVQPGGRSGLFDQPEAVVLAKTTCWLAEVDWRSTHEQGQKVSEEALQGEYGAVFGLSDSRLRQLGRVLREWRTAVPEEHRTANLVGEFYDLFAELGVTGWNLADPLQVNRLGTLARFTALLVDYESVRRRARPDTETQGEQIGGQGAGRWYYRNLALHIVNYAQGAYEGFDGEAGFALDAVDLTTVHRAKGLEWPVVFVPSLTAGRFPPGRNTAKVQDWLVPREAFAAARYEGSDADERRLFYVALTRARDWVSVSRHERVNTQRTAASPYWSENSDLLVAPADVVVPELASIGGPDGEDPVSVTYSELAQFLDCAMAYRLRSVLGFQPRLAVELGYGKAVHQVLRVVAEATRASGVIPSEAELEHILDDSFFLPTANRTAHRQLKNAARRLVASYVAEHAEDLHRVWETERPFELHLDGVIVSGRADVILDTEGGVPTALAIVDYKTSTIGELGQHDLQLQVYADAGRREGLDVRAAYVHDLKATRRDTIDVSGPAVDAAEAVVSGAAIRLRARDYAPNPGNRCRACEVRTVCPAAKR
jgi:DNA helicase-2/ATP-dependent DNA helicase PcrA